MKRTYCLKPPYSRQLFDADGKLALTVHAATPEQLEERCQIAGEAIGAGSCSDCGGEPSACPNELHQCASRIEREMVAR